MSRTCVCICEHINICMYIYVDVSMKRENTHNLASVLITCKFDETHAILCGYQLKISVERSVLEKYALIGD